MFLVSILSDSEFSNRGHFDNFVKYLFSQSRNHSANELTEKNAYLTSKNNSLSFVKSPNICHRNFLAELATDFDYSKYTNSIFYFNFLLEIRGRLISNFIEVDDKDSVSVLLDSEDSILSTYKSKESFYHDMQTLLDKHNNSIINFEDCTHEERMEVEVFLHTAVLNRVPSFPLINVSHNDQDSPYHIHSIVEKRK